MAAYRAPMLFEGWSSWGLTQGARARLEAREGHEILNALASYVVHFVDLGSSCRGSGRIWFILN
jgi:hypothetical protein